MYASKFPGERMKIRLLAILLKAASPLKVKHYRGAPPEATDDKDTRQEMGRASFLIIEALPDGVFLYRYDGQGSRVGDTWHENVADAEHQASYEYERRMSEWTDVPPEIEDVVAFGLGRAKKQE
jgi:hypothetical protein